MANRRTKRLSASGLENSPAGRDRSLPEWAAAAAVLAGGALALAWIDGGEEPLHPIAQDVALPAGEQGQ